MAVDITNCNFYDLKKWKLFVVILLITLPCGIPGRIEWHRLCHRGRCSCTAGELIDFDQSAQEMGSQHGIVSFRLRMNVDLISSHEIPFHFRCDRSGPKKKDVNDRNRGKTRRLFSDKIGMEGKENLNGVAFP